MLRGGVPRGAGLTLRVYEVCADGSERDLKPSMHTYGSRPVPASLWQPRRHAEASADPVWPPLGDDLHAVALPGADREAAADG